MLGTLRTRMLQRASRIALLAAATDAHRGPAPQLAGTIDFETSFGRLYLDEDDPVVTPGLIGVGEWEPGLTALFGERLSPGMVFVDVGAHVGYYTALAGRLVGPRGLVLAFEPNPRNYELLLANVWRNGLANVACFPWALSDETGFTDLYLSADNSGDHRIYAHEEGRPSVPVRTAALDTVTAIRPPVDVMKIDVQGAEEAVLRGAADLINASPDLVIVLEYAPVELRAFGSDERPLLDFYRSLGYSIAVQHSNEHGLLHLSDDEILESCLPEHGRLHTNLVLSRSST
jgi:FkbM family methyltransferase